MIRERQKGIAPRREVLILLPAALLLLALLSTYTLRSYRSAITLLAEERQAEAAQLARQLSSELASARSLPTSDSLRRRLPQASEVSVLELDEASAEGNFRPDEPMDSIVGSARFKRGSQMMIVRVTLPAAVLRGRQESLEILSPVLLSVNVAVTLLVVLFLRRFFAPFDSLIEKARDAGQAVPESQDEVTFLVETFEKALNALRHPANHGTQEIDELRALEGALARNLESGVLLLDAEGTVLALNGTGSSLLQIDPPEPAALVTKALERHPNLVELLLRAIRLGKTVQREECMIEVSGHERILGITAHPLRRDDAALKGFLVMFADLTEVQREIQEQQLVDSLSQLGELTAGVAHEMRNSLATLRGYLALVERGGKEESIYDYLGEIRHESDHLQRVLDDFLMFARPGSVRPQEVDLLGLAHRAAADPALGGAPVSLEADSTDLTNVPYQVFGDSQLLERALRNLLSNAVEAQREVGQSEPVSLLLSRTDADVEIEVKDRGGGLSSEAQEKLFDPFFSQRAEGVGMGLALTRRIILLHNGRVELANRPQGGTRAKIWLPRGKPDTEGNISPDQLRP